MVADSVAASTSTAGRSDPTVTTVGTTEVTLSTTSTPSTTTGTLAPAETPEALMNDLLTAAGTGSTDASPGRKRITGPPACPLAVRLTSARIVAVTTPGRR